MQSVNARRMAKLTLTPIVRDGRKCLACADVVGVECVTLKEVVFYFGGLPWQQVVRRSNDIFRLVEKGAFKWPAMERIERATFEIRLADTRRARRVTVCGSGWMAWPWGREVGPDKRWLVKRGFVEGAVV